MTKLRRIYAGRFRNLAFLFVAITLIAVFYYLAYRTLSFLRKFGLTPGTAICLIRSEGDCLKNTAGKTIFLILGTNGQGFTAGDLTDTIILISTAPGKPTKLLSVPRDLWSEDLKDKINSAYHYGEAKKIAGGMIMTKVTLEDLLGIPVHYGILIDLAVFTKIINSLGGLDIDVKEGFVDTDFPVPGKENDICGGDPEYRCRYEKVEFKAGLQHMNADRLQKYIRSRHADDIHGTDFDRMRRQQEVLNAVYSRLWRWQQIFAIRENLNLASLVAGSVKMDCRMSECIILAFNFIRQPKRINLSIDDLLYYPQDNLYAGRYILIPKTGLSEFQAVVRQRLQ